MEGLPSLLNMDQPNNPFLSVLYPNNEKKEKPVEVKQENTHANINNGHKLNILKAQEKAEGENTGNVNAQLSQVGEFFRSFGPVRF